MIIKIVIKKYLKNQLKKRFDEIKEITIEINQNSLIYNAARERFDDLNNGIEPFRKIESGETKLEEASQLNEI